jgi:hypothetical protein
LNSPAITHLPPLAAVILEGPVGISVETRIPDFQKGIADLDER